MENSLTMSSSFLDFTFIYKIFLTISRMKYESSAIADNKMEELEQHSEQSDIRTSKYNRKLSLNVTFSFNRAAPALLVKIESFGHVVT